MVWILIGVLAFGNVVTYGSMIVRERIVVAGAVKAERTEQVATCNSRVEQIGRAINEAADLRVATAEAAALDVRDVETDSEIEAICNSDPNCRDRKAK